MDEVMKARIEIAKQGGATAQTLIMRYYIYWTITFFFTAVTILVAIWLPCRCWKIWLNYEYKSR